MSRFELHVHTMECDKAAHMGGADIVHYFQDRGYDGMVVTDHNFSIFDHWFADELQGVDHRGRTERWLKGYRAARKEGEKCGFTVLLGAEVRFEGKENDYLIYGIDEEFLFNAPPLSYLDGLEELVSILPKDACVVQAHPFREKMSIIDPSLVFGIEVKNAGTEPFRNDIARLWAEHYQKPMTSGTDFHGKDRPFMGGIETDEPIRSMEDLLHTLKSGNYRLL